MKYEKVIYQNAYDFLSFVEHLDTDGSDSFIEMIKEFPTLSEGFNLLSQFCEEFKNKYNITSLSKEEYEYYLDIFKNYKKETKDKEYIALYLEHWKIQKDKYTYAHWFCREIGTNNIKILYGHFGGLSIYLFINGKAERSQDTNYEPLYYLTDKELKNTFKYVE